MSILKRVLLAMLLPILTLSLFGIAFSFGLRSVAGEPQKVKELLNDSGIYGTIVPNILAKAEKVSAEGGEVPLSDPTIKKAAQDAFTPQFVKQSAEEIIDSTYAWLEGKTKKPDFSIDLSDAKSAFSSSAAESVEQRLAGLPRCPAGTSSIDFNAFKATCLPRDITPASAAQRVRNDLLSGQGFIEETRINADSLKTKDSGKPVFGELNNFPAVYQLAKNAPLYLAVLAALTAAAIIFLSSTKRAGIQRVGISLIVIGGLMLLLTGLNSWVLSNKILPGMNFDNDLMAADIKALIVDIARIVNTNYYIFGGLYMVLGIGAIAGAKFTGRPQYPKTVPEKSNVNPAATDNKASGQNDSAKARLSREL